MPHLGVEQADPREVAVGGWEARPTLAEVGEDVVLPKLGSGCTHLGVAEAEAAGAAGRVVGLQAEGPGAAPGRSACPPGAGGGGGESGRFTGSQLGQGEPVSLGTLQKICIEF